MSQVEQFGHQTLRTNHRNRKDSQRGRATTKLTQSFLCVRDDINDSIALKKANVLVSLRGATTIATDGAQVVLMA